MIPAGTGETDQEGRRERLLEQFNIMAVCLLQFHFFAGLSFYTTDQGLLGNMLKSQKGFRV